MQQMKLGLDASGSLLVFFEYTLGVRLQLAEASTVLLCCGIAPIYMSWKWISLACVWWDLGKWKQCKETRGGCLGATSNLLVLYAWANIKKKIWSHNNDLINALVNCIWKVILETCGAQKEKGRKLLKMHEEPKLQKQNCRLRKAELPCGVLRSNACCCVLKRWFVRWSINCLFQHSWTAGYMHINHVLAFFS